MSSLQRNGDNLESLFSFEILLEYVRIDKERSASHRQLALGLRMLDFPTLIIYQPEQNVGGGSSSSKYPPQGHRGDEKHDKDNVATMASPCQHEGEYIVNKGKSCLFKMNVDTLHSHLSCTPLFATVLDVKDELPTLVGTSQISLTKLVDRIKWDVSAHGILSPSSHGEKNVVGLYDLLGEKIGLVSLGYKLVSLGPSLLPHVSAKHSTHGSKCMQENSLTNTWLLQSPKLQESDSCKDLQINGQLNKKETSAMQEDVNCVATQIEHKPRSETHEAPQENEQTLEEDLAVFCPPHLFYNSAVDKTGKNEAKDHKLLKLKAELLSMEDVWSEEDGETESKPQGPKSPLIDERVTHDAKMRSGQDHQEIGVTPNVLGEALRQLPLLNALLVELSQLNGQTRQEPLNIHPNLAWIYKPSTETSVSLGSPLREDKTKLMYKTRRVARPCLEAIHLPKNVSPAKPVQERQVKCSKMRREDVCPDNKPFHTCNRKKLAYGTTKTFHLRLKQNKATISNANKVIKQRNKILNQRTSLDEHVETVMSSVAVDAKQDNENPKHSYSDTRLLISISSMDDDQEAQQKVDDDNQSESGQTQSGSQRSKEKMETPASSQVNSPKSTNSDPTSGGEGVEDYIDDFTSLDPSDGCSPDPVVIFSPDPLSSSPEPAFAKTPRSPAGGDRCSSDSTTERIHKKTVLPVPVKAPSSPQQSLRGTHIIRPRTLASALSVSSDNDDRDGPPTVRFRTQKANSSRAKNSSITESFEVSRSRKSAKGFEPRDVEELGDELGSLDLKNNYQHISELVAHKLPGYTM